MGKGCSEPFSDDFPEALSTANLENCLQKIVKLCGRNGEKLQQYQDQNRFILHFLAENREIDKAIFYIHSWLDDNELFFEDLKYGLRDCIDFSKNTKSMLAWLGDDYTPCLIANRIKEKTMNTTEHDHQAEYLDTSDNSENIRHFFENYAECTEHVRHYNCEADMIYNAYERSNGAADYIVLRYYIDMVLDYYMVGMSHLVVYMPEMFGPRKFKGKIIIETYSGCQFYFEIQLARQSDFTKIKKTDLGNDPCEGDPWHRIFRFHNIVLAKEQAIPFVQELLFLDLFRQRSLITIDPDVMGSMTAQQLRAGSGQVLSFRRCVLNE